MYLALTIRRSRRHRNHGAVVTFSS
ncbi:hypothetical protein CLIM01_12281 [Colletotrichum limetticola]|uniref:Uncharacterized protein n=1 Tax=Colletotrichum limetticola TaxID=1209924 RepID=A0ABQ9PE79_9PEZI|nr:hypothetical protein CLIM01_12281 [Colletotrichum limetticola]